MMAKFASLIIDIFLGGVSGVYLTIYNRQKIRETATQIDTQTIHVHTYTHKNSL